MKNILLLISIIFTVSFKAQTIVPLRTSSFDSPENPYYKDLDNELDKYVGVWKYQDGNTIFTVNFVKREKVKSIDSYDDRITGWYLYVENGNTVVNTTLTPDYFYFIYGSNLSDDGNRIILHFEDPERPKMEVQMSLDYIDGGLGGETKLEWRLYHVATGFRFSDEPRPLTSFRVPTELTLTKQ